MSLTSIVQDIEASGLGEWMRTSVKAMPLVESLHVLAAATVFGTVLIVDLRLLGLASQQRPVTRISQEMLRFTWAAFIVAVITGVMMFAANANTYFVNTAFRLKLLALLAAGVNMAVFHGVTFRAVATWDQRLPTPRAAQIAGLLSIAIWVTVIFLARWIGFTKGYNFDVPQDLDFSFE